MKYLILFISLFLSLQLFAQSAYPDLVYLKNGSMLRCKILDYKPNESIKIEIQGGSIFVYKSDEVAEIEKGSNTSQSNNNNLTKKDNREYHIYGKEMYISTHINFTGGYMERSSWWGGPQDVPTLGIGAKISAGMSLNRHLMIGAGVAWAYMNNFFMYSTHIPVFAEVRGDIIKKNNAIYYTFGLGYNFAKMRANTSSWTTGATMTDAKDGIYINPGLGLRFAAAQKSHFFIEFNYAIHTASYSYMGANGELIGPTKNTFTRPTLAFGLLF
jgi:hypothetical protein